jgi:hypothetical protein
MRAKLLGLAYRCRCEVALRSAAISGGRASLWLSGVLACERLQELG